MFINDSALKMRTNEEKAQIATVRFSLIVSKNLINYDKQNLGKHQPLVATRFSSEGNYLWDRCKYFTESNDSFYVRVFLECGKFCVGKQVFAQKLDETRYNNVEIVESQTVLLLAEMNDQSCRDEMSIYYTQTQRNLEYTQYENKGNDEVEKSQMTFEYDGDEASFWQPSYGDKNESKNLVNKMDDYCSSNKDGSFSEVILDETQNSSCYEEAKETVEINDSGEMNVVEDVKVVNNDSSFDLKVREVEKFTENEFFDIDDDFERVNCSQVADLANNDDMDEYIIGQRQTLNENDDCGEKKRDEEIELVIDNIYKERVKEVAIVKSSKRNEMNCEVEKSEKNLNEDFDLGEEKTCGDLSQNEALNQDHCFDDFSHKDESQIDIAPRSPPSLREQDHQINSTDDSNDIEIKTSSEINTATDAKLTENSIEIIELSSNDSNYSVKPLNTCQKKASINFLFSSSDPEDSNDSESSSCSKKNLVRFRSIFSDEQPVQALDKASFKCLVDETILSSNSSSSSSSSTNSEDTVEKSNILDQNVDLDDTCLDQSQLQNDDLEDKVAVLEDKRKSVSLKRKAIFVNLVEKPEDNIFIEDFCVPDEKKIKISQEVNDNKVLFDKNEDQIIDDVWDNFGDQNQFDDYYIGFDNNVEDMNTSTTKSANNSPEKKAFDVWSNFNGDDYVLQHPQEDLDNETLKFKNEDPEKDLLVLKRKTLISEEVSAVAAREIQCDPTVTPKIDTARIKPKTAVQRLKNTDPQTGDLTPMAQYGDMNTPDLKFELKKYGIKPLTKKQAVKKLVEIYQYTHKSKLKRSASCMGFNTPKVGQNDAVVINQKKGLRRVESSMCIEDGAKKKKLKKQTSDVGLDHRDNKASGEPSVPILKIGNSKPPKAPKKAQPALLNELTMVEQINELQNGIDDSDEDESTSSNTQRTKKIKKNLDEIELREYVCRYLRNDEHFYLNVLNYIPLDLDSFHSNLQQSLAPRRANSKLLMKVLDEFCVTFTMKNCSTKTHQGKPKYQKKH